MNPRKIRVDKINGFVAKYLEYDKINLTGRIVLLIVYNVSAIDYW